MFYYFSINLCGSDRSVFQHLVFKTLTIIRLLLMVFVLYFIFLCEMLIRYIFTIIKSNIYEPNKNARIDKVTYPIQKFIQKKAGGIVLGISVIIALFLANSP